MQLPGCFRLTLNSVETSVRLLDRRVLVMWVPSWRAEVPGELRPSTGYSSCTVLREELSVLGWLGSLQRGTVYPSVATPCTCLDISVCIFYL